MPHHFFTLDNLPKLDSGKVALAFSHELRRCALDCIDRPGDSSVRTVAIKAALKPVLDADGSCDTVEVEFEVSGKVPVRRSKVFSMATKATGALLFSEDSPDNVDQRTIFDGEADPPAGDGKSQAAGE